MPGENASLPERPPARRLAAAARGEVEGREMLCTGEHLVRTRRPDSSYDQSHRAVPACSEKVSRVEGEAQEAVAVSHVRG